ncbi:MAG: hypothetical protein BWY87_01234 [Deltaproteobacteria bacterium ADurb.Bin510]|nr:MAG: hypothetical protein BWY87_01234 [Deltaproteobacteria bacterium ADurb.Bin510]
MDDLGGAAQHDSVRVGAGWRRFEPGRRLGSGQVGDADSRSGLAGQAFDVEQEAHDQAASGRAEAFGGQDRPARQQQRPQFGHQQAFGRLAIAVQAAAAQLLAEAGEHHGPLPLQVVGQPPDQSAAGVEQVQQVDLEALERDRGEVGRAEIGIVVEGEDIDVVPAGPVGSLGAQQREFTLEGFADSVHVALSGLVFQRREMGRDDGMLHHIIHGQIDDCNHGNQVEHLASNRHGLRLPLSAYLRPLAGRRAGRRSLPASNKMSGQPPVSTAGPADGRVCFRSIGCPADRCRHQSRLVAILAVRNTSNVVCCIYSVVFVK